MASPNLRDDSQDAADFNMVQWTACLDVIDRKPRCVRGWPMYPYRSKLWVACCITSVFAGEDLNSINYATDLLTSVLAAVSYATLPYQLC